MDTRYRTTRGRLLHDLLLIVPTSVLSCLVTLWIAYPASSPPLPPPAIDTEQLIQRLDELASQIDDNMLAASRSAGLPTIERQPMPEALAGEMSRIIERLEYLVSVVRTGGVGNQVPVQREMQINWSDLDGLKALGEANWKTAEESVILMTPPEVVARFGFPSQVQTSERYDMTWFYMRDEQSGKPDATIHFNGGYVVSARFF